MGKVSLRSGRLNGAVPDRELDIGKVFFFVFLLLHIFKHILIKVFVLACMRCMFKCNRICAVII